MGARSPAHISPTRARHGPEYYWARAGTGTIAGPCLGLNPGPWTRPSTARKSRPDRPDGRHGGPGTAHGPLARPGQQKSRWRRCRPSPAERVCKWRRPPFARPGLHSLAPPAPTPLGLSAPLAASPNPNPRSSLSAPLPSPSRSDRLLQLRSPARRRWPSTLPSSLCFPAYFCIFTGRLAFSTQIRPQTQSSLYKSRRSGRPRSRRRPWCSGSVARPMQSRWGT
ncbi:hypothetical protein PVAP13_9KG647060 [Panicum virgatum]|uniref:Uncharacterized protein n=1 Tax=Panicum virgatum TaxID=38727 RepID=A0A8T0NXR6_PANVG|nr:hypothetical protein PVAP13_9KG647060 [Panicum virgatum]